MQAKPLTISEHKNVVHVLPSPGVPLDELKPYLYNALAKFEPNKQVRIHNIPFCLLPDATENIVQDKGEQTSACKKCSLQAICKGPLPEHHASFNHAPFQSMPRELAIEVNRVCAFTCHFCFYHTFSEPNEQNTLPKDKIFELIDQMVERNIPHLRLFGGDPLFHPDIMEILRYAKKSHRFVILNTNGIFKKDSMREVMDLVDAVIISLHGFDEKTEQELTGRGDLLKPVVKALFELGHTYPEKTTCSTLITTHLINSFEKYKKIIEASGVRNWAMNRPLFLKKEFDMYDWLRFEPNEVINLAGKVNVANQSSRVNIVINNYPHCFFPKGLRHLVWHNNSCNGVYRMFYDIDGYFKPTPSININLGSTLDDSWEQNPFNDLGERKFAPAACKSCDLFMNCLGGSRSQAHMFNDDYFGKDPYMRPL